MLSFKDTGVLMMYSCIYALLLIIGEYIINVSLTKALCGTSQLMTALKVTVIPWIIIFGLLNILLKIFPGWLSPFSNTFGYAITRLAGINNLMNDIFLSDIKSSDTNLKSANEALAYIYTDKSLLINEISIENFDDFWSHMKPLMKQDADNFKDSLFNMIRLKDIVAEYIWYLLSGVLVTSVSYNYIINSGCRQSIKEINSRMKKYEMQETKRIKENLPDNKRVYTSNE